MRRQNLIILASLVIAFIAAGLLSNSVFLANTPRLNPLFLVKIKDITNPNTLLSLLLNKNQYQPDTMQIAGLNLPQVKNVPNVVFKPISRNVYAGFDSKSNTQYITIKKGAKMEIRAYKIRMSDGTEKEIKLLVPLNAP